MQIDGTPNRPFTLSDENLEGDDATPVLLVGGDLDSFTAGDFRRRMLSRLFGGGGSLLVDLLGCGFIDSAACGALLAANRGARALGGQLVVVADHPQLTRAFEIMGLGDLFGVTATRADGALALTGPRRSVRLAGSPCE